MKKHFVTFFSPGTIVTEETTREIDSWDVEQAVEMAREITERHNATPYGFVFTTRERGDTDLDSAIVARSGNYFLGGKIENIVDIKARNDAADSILISNMEGNGFRNVLVNTNSWKVTVPFLDGDTLLEFQAVRN